MVTQFVNHLMWEGKKSTALTIFYDALDIVAERTKQEEHALWKKALNNVMPQVEVRSRRIGGATFQIPTEIRAKRKTSIGMKWLIKFSRQRSGKGMAEKLAAEIIAASKGEGAAVKRKEDTHRMAESNRAFAHFRV
jgi:small subunit ribosomal protein S7